MNELNIPMNVAIVGLIGILALFITLILVLIKNQNRQANLCLAGFFLSLSIGYFLQIPHYGHYFESISWLGLAFPFSFSATAFILYFVQTSLNKEFSLKSNWAYLLPFASALILSIFSIASLLPNSIESSIIGFPGFLANEVFIFYLTFLNLRTINRYKSYLSQNVAEYHHHRYQWIRFIVLASLIYSLFPLLFGIIAHITNFPVKSQIIYIIAGALTVTYLLLVLIKTVLNSNHTTSISTEQLFEGNIASYSKKPDQKQQMLFETIEVLLSQTQLFKQADLNLDRLAEELSKPKREVSICINLCSKNNFYEYINDHRIEATKNILSTNPDAKLTIMEVMYDVGYNSKSSFNAAFKSRIGMTPFQFRKKKLEEMSSNT